MVEHLIDAGVSETSELDLGHRTEALRGEPDRPPGACRAAQCAATQQPRCRTCVPRVGRWPCSRMMCCCRASERIDAGVIDVATLKPLDAATILESVSRTGRISLVHGAPMTCGYGAEIAARVAGRALTSLLAPIERVAGYDTMMPYPRTEAFYMPNVERGVAAGRGDEG